VTCIVTRDRASWHVTVHRDMWPCIVTNFFIKIQLDVLNSQIYFGNENLHVSDSSSIHHQELFAVHSAMVYVIQACSQLSSRIRMERSSILCQFQPDPARKLPVPSWSCPIAISKPVWHIPLLSVQWVTPYDGQRNCPKHVEFHFQNKFENLVHLVGFIVRK
jgi:hypothetical protein